MNTLNKRRSGDENIGKLIVFAITIVIAIGLVGLVSYFYTQSREAAVTNGILGSTASSSTEIKQVLDKYFTTSCAGTAATISYEAISGVYTLGGGSTCDLQAPDKAIKGLKATGTGTYTLSN